MSEPVLIEVIGMRYGAIPEMRTNKVNPWGVAHGHPLGTTDGFPGLQAICIYHEMATIVERIPN